MQNSIFKIQKILIVFALCSLLFAPSAYAELDRDSTTIPELNPKTNLDSTDSFIIAQSVDSANYKVYFDRIVDSVEDSIRGAIVDAWIKSGAAIALNKLASGTAAYFIVNNVSGVPTYVAMSGDGTLSNAGALTIAANAIGTSEITDGTIVTADISGTAAIELTKLASGTAAYIIVNNVSGVPTYVALGGDATISNGGVLTIAANAITSAEITDNTVASADILDGTIATADILDGTIASTDLANSLTFGGRPTFTGATFGTADWGVVSFADSVAMTGLLRVVNGTVNLEGTTTTTINDLNMGGNFRLPAAALTTTEYGTMKYLGGDGTALVAFDYGAASTDTMATLRYLLANYAKLTGNNTLSGNVTYTKPQIYTPSDVTVSAGSSGLDVSGYSKIVKMSNTEGAGTLLDLSSATDGQEIILHNSSASTYSITIDDGAEFQLDGSADRVLGAGDSIHLWYDADVDIWYEVNGNN